MLYEIWQKYDHRRAVSPKPTRANARPSLDRRNLYVELTNSRIRIADMPIDKVAIGIQCQGMFQLTSV